jgi:hypothetical protein
VNIWNSERERERERKRERDGWIENTTQQEAASNISQKQPRKIN